MARGYKSITLLGQNVNSYGLDRNGTGDLLCRAACGGSARWETPRDRDFWVYFTSPHPRDMTEEAMQRHQPIIPASPKQIHLPIQSGDDRILIRMNRNYMVDQYREKMRMISDHPPAGHAVHGHHRGLQRGDGGAVREHAKGDAGVPVQHGLRGHVLPPARRGQLPLARRRPPRGKEQTAARAQRRAGGELHTRTTRA